MVTIRRGTETLTVTRGAYSSIYASQGWVEDTNSGAKKDDFTGVTKNKESILLDRQNVLTDPKKDMKIQNADNGANANGIEDEIDLSEIPLSEMSIPQLKAYAHQLGVTVNTDSAKALRNQIRRALEG